MYLFTRSVRFAPGHLADSMAWAVGMADRVNTGTDLDVRLFSRVFSPGFLRRGGSTLGLSTDLGTNASACHTP